jgi:hypothetical protein
MLKLSARTLKATVVLDPAALVDVIVPNGQPKFSILVEVGGRPDTESGRNVSTTLRHPGSEFKLYRGSAAQQLSGSVASIQAGFFGVGGLIHVAVGLAGGTGGLTKRSGFFRNT